jgi:hypothetical protein
MSSGRRSSDIHHIFCSTKQFFRYLPTIRQWLIKLASRRTYLSSLQYEQVLGSEVQPNEALRVRGSTWMGWSRHDLENDGRKNGGIDTTGSLD